jgi:hypothetical protein
MTRDESEPTPAQYSPRCLRPTVLRIPFRVLLQCFLLTPKTNEEKATWGPAQKDDMRLPHSRASHVRRVRTNPLRNDAPVRMTFVLHAPHPQYGHNKGTERADIRAGDDQYTPLPEYGQKPATS